MRRLARPSLVLAVLCAAAPLRADDGEADALVVQAAALRQSVDGYAEGRRVRAVPLLAYRGRCARVGLLYPDVRGRGGPRIDTYEVCGRQAADTGEVSPALPDDARTREVARAAMVAAAAYGRRTVDWQGYRFDALRLSPPDSYGCARVETTVLFDGLLVDNSAGRICP